VRRDDELLEPILPKSPPTADDVARADEVLEPVPDAPGAGLRTPWERWLLLGCAVAATLCLVLITVRLTSIAEDQRVQTCQTRVFASEQLEDFDGRAGRGAQRQFAQELAKCVGLELPADSGD
jgi:hypothetical protein